MALNPDSKCNRIAEYDRRQLTDPVRARQNPQDATDMQALIDELRVAKALIEEQDREIVRLRETLADIRDTATIESVDIKEKAEAALKL